MTMLNNPGIPSGLAFDPVIYASARMNYAAALAQYHPSDAPDAAYVTSRIVISAFGELGRPCRGRSRTRRCRSPG